MLQYRKYTEIITPHSHNAVRRNAACTDSFGHTYECSDEVSPAGAFPYDAALTFTLGCSDIPERASLYIHADGLSSGKGEQGMRLAMERSMCDGGCLFFVRIERGVLAQLSEGGLFYYRYELDFRTDTTATTTKVQQAEHIFAAAVTAQAIFFGSAVRRSSRSPCPMG